MELSLEREKTRNRRETINRVAEGGDEHEDKRGTG